MKNKMKFGALLLAGAMMLGMSTGAMAADDAATETDATVSVTKEFELAAGLSLPETTTFSFTATKVTQDAPEATIPDIIYTKANTGNYTDKSTDTTRHHLYEQTSQISFGTFPHAGTYEYTVTETAGSDTGVTYDSQVYTMKVNVLNKTNGTGLYVSTIAVAEQGKDVKTDLTFKNVYTSNSAKLTISKNVAGDLADKTKDFSFTILMTKSVTDGATTAFTGKIGEQTVTVTPDVEATFTLHHGQSLVFDNLPVGTRYVVTEQGAADDYFPGVVVTENGTKTRTVTRTTNDTDSLRSADSDKNNLVGEGENSVIFTNTNESKPATGIVMNNLPFILLIAFVGAAFILLAVAKRQRTARHQ